MKKCSRCHRELPESEFYKNISSKDGLQSWCKSCTNDYDKNVRLSRIKKKMGDGESCACRVHPSPTYRRTAETRLYRRIEIHANYQAMNNDFAKDERDSKVQAVQGEINALERGEFNYYVPPTYINKIKNWIRR